MLIETSVIKDDEILEAEVLSEIVNVGGGTGIPYEGEYSVTPSEVTQTLATADRYLNSDVVVNPIPSDYIVPEGVLSIDANDTYDVTSYASAEVNVQPSLQSKSVTPSEELQNVVADAEFDGLSEVTVEPIPSEYEVPDVYPYNLRIRPLRTQQTYPTANKKLLSDVVVNAVPVEQGQVTITQNNSGNILSPPQNKFFDEVNVTVAIPEQTKTISITENGTTEVLPDEGKVLSGVTVEVDVQSGGTVGKPYVDSSQLKSIRYLYDSRYGNQYMGANSIDTRNVTDFYCAFYLNRDITTIDFDTSKGEDFTYCLYGCRDLTDVSGLNLASAKTLNYFFGQTFLYIDLPELNTANATSFTGAFERFYGSTIAKINLSNNAKTYYNIFYNCINLANITFEGTIPIFDDTFKISDCPLTEASLTSLVNALHNKDGATHTITLGASNIAKLTEAQLQSIADKNINIQ